MEKEDNVLKNQLKQCGDVVTNERNHPRVCENSTLSLIVIKN